MTIMEMPTHIPEPLNNLTIIKNQLMRERYVDTVDYEIADQRECDYMNKNGVGLITSNYIVVTVTSEFTD
jgi:hypothetical protein